MTYKFTITLTKEGKWFVARCLELGVVTQGKNIKEAQKNIKEAVELYLEEKPKGWKYLSKESPLITTMELKYA